MLEPPVTAVCADGDYGIFEGALEDRVVFAHYRRHGRWSPALLSLLTDRLLAGGGTFIGAGAHIGLVSIPVAQRTRARCLAFEPEPRNFAFLSRNVMRHGLGLRVERHEIALYSSRASITMARSEHNFGDHRVLARDASRHARTVRVRAAPPDQLLSGRRLARLIVLKRSRISRGSRGTAPTRASSTSCSRERLASPAALAEPPIGCRQTQRTRVTVHDFAVIGAGIAGASVAYELRARGSVVLLEREPLPGHHTTGRSAAFLVESYGSAVVGRLTRGGRRFLETPPEGFADHPLVHPRPVLWIAREDQRERLAAALQRGRQSGADLRRLDLARARELCPVLRDGYVADAIVEPNALSIDVAGLLEAFLRGLRRRGGEIVTKAEVTRIVRAGDAWEIEAGGRTVRAGVVVNASGAWCDRVGRMAGARPIGLRPLRRTVVTFDPPPGSDIRAWPCVIDADEEFYVKPEGAQLLASPCDEVPSEPCDALPDDYQVALAAERVQRATTLGITHIRRRWAGLRSFVADRSPVIGMDPELPGFFWLAGQGGSGIMTSPAAARTAAALIADGVLPADTPEQLAPARLRREAAVDGGSAG
jgi:D-arginine dehydrogenase